MAHFAELNEINEVLRVIVINNSDILDVDGNESEDAGISFCKALFGENTKWKQTSYNNNIRKNYAGVGMSYSETLDAFIPVSPYPSWVLNEQTCQWEAPVQMPSDGKLYRWDEASTSWLEVVQQTPVGG